MAASATTSVLLAGLYVVALCLSVAVGVTKAAEKTIFEDYITDHGRKLEVADPVGDANESEGVDMTSDQWQTQILKGLIKQRIVEKKFLKKLDIGGKTLNDLVAKIFTAFDKLESSRKEKSLALIKKHFTNEEVFLKTFQKNLQSDLSAVLDAASDLTEKNNLKSKIRRAIDKNLQEQLASHEDLLKSELDEIKEKHKADEANVKSLYSLIRGWRDSFSTALKKSKTDMQNIMEQWETM